MVLSFMYDRIRGVCGRGELRESYETLIVSAKRKDFARKSFPLKNALLLGALRALNKYICCCQVL